MFNRLFGKRDGDGGRTALPAGPGCPEVDERPDIETVFDKARKAARGEDQSAPGRHVVLVTPGRMLMFQPCPPPGSMPPAQVASIEKMMSPQVKRNIAAIAFTEFRAPTDITKNIPFLGILLGFAYIGHAVWVFEGHRSALQAGCRDAEVLIVDGGMIPHLQEDWIAAAEAVMRTREIYVHDRATYSLRRAGSPA